MSDITSQYSNKHLWIEKYRAKDLDELVIDDNFKKIINKYLVDPKILSNLILVGEPGTGKTSLARIIIDKLINDSNDVLILNGSDQRGIQTIRVLVNEFISTKPMFSVIKIVLIDEADYLTPEAWAALRHMIEKYSSNVRFIFTANENKFPAAIKSRCLEQKFNVLSKDYIQNFLTKILTNEKIEFTQDNLQIIMNMFYPDLRKIVNSTQSLVIDNKLDVSNITNLLKSEEILIQMTISFMKEILNNNKTNINRIKLDIVNLISQQYVDYVSVYKYLFKYLNFILIPIKVIISKYTNQIPYAVVPSMNYLVFIDELEKTLQNFIGIISSQDIMQF